MTCTIFHTESGPEPSRSGGACCYRLAFQGLLKMYCHDSICSIIRSLPTSDYFWGELVLQQIFCALNCALDEERNEEEDQLTKENYYQFNQRGKNKSSFYYYRNRIGHDRSLLNLVGYLQILICNYYPNNFLIFLARCVKINKLRVLWSMQHVFILTVHIF